jgi:hypothetical protein
MLRLLRKVPVGFGIGRLPRAGGDEPVLGVAGAEGRLVRRRVRHCPAQVHEYGEGQRNRDVGRFAADGGSAPSGVFHQLP